MHVIEGGGGVKKRYMNEILYKNYNSNYFFPPLNFY